MTNTNQFSYNSNRETLIISEYGRHIQNLVNYAKSIDDKEKRQATVENIISLMHQKVDKNKSQKEQMDTLWKHLFRIADYNIDVDVPEGVKIIRPEEKDLELLSYPESNKKFRHYGILIQRLIQKVTEMEDGPKKEEAKSLIASYMKMAYRTWNKEHFVNDDMIKSDLNLLSNGALKANDDINLNYLGRSSRGNNKNKHSSKSKKSRRKRKRNR